MTHWSQNAFFYHIYPLGLCGAPLENHFNTAPEPRLDRIYEWLDHMQYLGINALYLGPVFESSTHGYDTANYFTVDRRLGTNDTLAMLSSELKRRGIKLILDGVFHHVGRDFWAFRDLQQNGEASAFKDWFFEVDFSRQSPYGDPFTYHAWRGHFNLVKLQLHHPDVINHLFHAVSEWMDLFEIDGLRLDVADCLDHEFMKKLAAFTKQKDPDFWLMGEVIHGDYRQWVTPDKLDAVTNYECFKGLYSSHLDKNFFEIAYSLKRQFGPKGMYKDLLLYNFADNHDVDRVAGRFKNPAHLYSLYSLLFTIPGIPSIYYGSEWGVIGEKQGNSDQALRPALDIHPMQNHPPQPNLPNAIAQLAKIRQDSRALRLGSYSELHVNHQQLAFLREYQGESVIVAVNASDAPVTLKLKVPVPGAQLRDVLNQNQITSIENHMAEVKDIPAHWAKIMMVE